MQAKLIIAASLALTALGQDDVSRLGQDIKMVVVLGTSGIQYPEHNFGLAVD